MIRNTDELVEAIATAEQNNDLAALEELEKYFRQSQEPAPLPLMPALEFNEALFAEPLAPLESDNAIPFANWLSRAMRKIHYQRKRNSGYTGPIIVAEGDSWFEYPVLLDDILDHLMPEFAVLSLAGAGHHLAEMVTGDEYTQAIAAEQADFFLVSGGGNDMLHSGRLAEFLHPFQAGMGAQDLIERATFDSFRQTLETNYQTMISGLVQQFPKLTILVHGYDYVVPLDGGTWLGGPLAQRQVPTNLWTDVMELIIDDFNATLKLLESRFPGRVFHIDLRGRVGNLKSRWFDELHPKSAGYQRVAARFAERIRAIQQATPLHETLVGAGIGVEITPMVARVPAPINRDRRAASRRRRTSSRALEMGSSLGSPEVAANLMAQNSPIDPSSLAMPFDDLSLDLHSRQPMTEAVIHRRVDTPSLRADEHVLRAILAPTPTTQPPHTAPIAPEPAPVPGMVAVITAHPCTSPASWQARFEEEDWEAYGHYRALLEEETTPDNLEQTETRRELTPWFDLITNERIIGPSNIFQVNFLSRGERAARAVGRISVMNKHSIPMGFGTGFLVAPGLVLTNHHVIDAPALANYSYFLLDYEYDADNELKQVERFNFSGDLFFTSRELDFTFISVAPTSRTGRKLADYGQLRLIRESGKALKGEYVSILQHANGLPKQIAIHDSEIIGRKDQYIYYTTDTNSGSSGAPVVNDQWFPVALHHRAVPDPMNPCSYVANRGIRISSIYELLDQAAAGNDLMAQQILHLIDPPSVPA